MEKQLKIDFDKIVKNLKLSKKDIELREKNLNKFIELLSFKINIIF